MNAHNLNLQRYETIFQKSVARDPAIFACPLKASSWGAAMSTQYVHEPFEGIPGFTIISVGSPVTLTLNQMSSGRLFNGSIGKVVDKCLPMDTVPVNAGQVGLCSFW